MTDQPRADVELLADPAQRDALQTFGQGDGGGRLDDFGPPGGRVLADPLALNALPPRAVPGVGRGQRELLQRL
ncbi:hypothetical protein [Streptomyces sp. NPDC001410]|uniref:hypothetical protein n=1 Tax=Streptomyces sp. NPDC001410 TaxID=3364574 RepID=UPI0036763BA9